VLEVAAVLREYVALGLDPGRFLDLTPRQCWLEMDGALERGRRQRALVWWGAMLPNLKDPPDLDEFVRRGPGGAPRPQRPQSPEAMDAMIKGLAVAWGAKVE